MPDFRRPRPVMATSGGRGSRTLVSGVGCNSKDHENCHHSRRSHQNVSSHILLHFTHLLKELKLKNVEKALSVTKPATDYFFPSSSRSCRSCWNEISLLSISAALNVGNLHAYTKSFLGSSSSVTRELALEPSPSLPLCLSHTRTKHPRTHYLSRLQAK